MLVLCLSLLLLFFHRCHAIVLFHDLGESVPVLLLLLPGCCDRGSLLLPLRLLLLLRRNGNLLLHFLILLLPAGNNTIPGLMLVLCLSLLLPFFHRCHALVLLPFGTRCCLHVLLNSQTCTKLSNLTVGDAIVRILLLRQQLGPQLSELAV